MPSAHLDSDGGLLPGTLSFVVAAGILMVVEPCEKCGIPLLDGLFVNGGRQYDLGKGGVIPTATAATFDSELGDGRCLAVESYRGGKPSSFSSVSTPNSVPASSSATLEATATVLHGVGAVGIETVIDTDLVDGD